MDLAQILQWNLSLFLLVFSRWASMVMLAPLFGARGVPGLVKLGLAVSLSIILYPIILAANPTVPLELLPFVGLLLKEMLVGLVIGFVISMITSILQGAGQLIDLQMGFTMANLVDPVNGMQGPMMGNFEMILATMILLATNAHHYLITAMVKSYQYIPLNVYNFPVGMDYYTSLISHVFSLSIQLALPVFGALVLGDIGVGLLTRTVPQLNIFSVMFPVKIIFGFVLLLLALPLFGDSVNQLFKLNMNWLLELYRGWAQ